jgi:S1-C subfamily serine protease
MAGLKVPPSKDPHMTSLLVLPCLLLAWADPPLKGEDPIPARPTAYDIVSAMETVLSEAIAKAEPSIVAIDRAKAKETQQTLAVRGRKEIFEPPDFPIASQRSFGVPPTDDFVSFDYGSGVVIGDEGQILTAFHVVRGARQITVRAADRQVFLAEVIAADPRSDLAVIAPKQINGMPAPRLKPLPIGDATKLRKGNFLIVLGNPFNAARDGKPSASWGILSNRSRRLILRDEENLKVRDDILLGYPTLLQLDAKLNLGMSGGAVINFKGELVGLTTMASSPAGFDSQAGYALPMDTMGRRAVELLKQGREVEYGVLGVVARNGTTNIVANVGPGTPADRAGLLVDDEVVGVDDAAVTDFDTLVLAINARNPGDPIKLKIRRRGELLQKTLELGKLGVDGEVIATSASESWRGLRVNYKTSSRFIQPDFERPIMPRPGVVITSVEEGSPASTAGLKVGQIIHSAAGKNVTKPSQFVEAVAGQDGPVKLETDLGPVLVAP